MILGRIWKVTGARPLPSPSSSLPKAAHLGSRRVTNRLFSLDFQCSAVHSLHSSGLECGPNECRECLVQKEELRVGFPFFLWGRSFCWLPGSLLRGNSPKAWLGRQISQLCTKQNFWVCFWNLVDITNASWCVRAAWLASEVTGADGNSLGGHDCFQVLLSLTWCLLDEFILICLFFCSGGWMAWSLWSTCDDSGFQTRNRVCGAQSSTPCVGNATQRRDCNEIPGELVSFPTHHSAPFGAVIEGWDWLFRGRMRKSSLVQFWLCPWMSQNTLQAFIVIWFSRLLPKTEWGKSQARIFTGVLKRLLFQGLGLVCCYRMGQVFSISSCWRKWE